MSGEEKENRIHETIKTAFLKIPTCLVIILVCCVSPLFLFFSFPPTDWMTRIYFDGVIEGNLDKALIFSRDSYRFPICRKGMSEDALNDIKQFGGSEVRNVDIKVEEGGGSDETIQIGRVSFEYRKPGNVAWQKGYTRIITTYDFGFRFTCGKYP